MANTSPKMGKLSDEIKGLVNQGVYSLYTVVGVTGNQYILSTDQGDSYLLSEDGDVLQEKLDTARFKLGEPIRFPGVQSGWTTNLNYKIG